MGLGIIGTQFLWQRTSPTLVISRPMLFAAVAAVTLAAAVAGVSMRSIAVESLSPLTGTKARGIGAFLAGANVGAVLLAVPVGLLVWRFHADSVGGWTYPFVNKRWLVALYYIA